MSDTDRVLAALAMAGARGITRVEFQAPNVCDGGKPILNFPARIYELRHKHGMEIVKVGRRNSCDVLALARAVEATQQGRQVLAPRTEAGPATPKASDTTGRHTASPTAESPSAPDALFDLEPRNAILGDAA